MSAQIIETDEELALDRGKASEIRAELAARPEDVNAASVEFNVGTEMEQAAEVAAAPAPQPVAPAADAYDGADVPELKGKTAKEIAREYANLHRQIGANGSELGRIRRQVDDAIKADLAARLPAKPAPAPVDDAAFFADPADAVSKAIESNPEIAQLKQIAAQVVQERVAKVQTHRQQVFAQANPDAKETLNDPAFKEWVKQSPYRQKMLLQAHKQYDVNLANELMETWRGVKPARVTKAQPQQAALLTKRPQATQQRQPAPADKGETFRRADVLRLMETDPDRYEQMADRIAAAYKAGRVK